MKKKTRSRFDNESNHIKNQASLFTPNLEQVVGDESLAKKENKGLDTPVSLHIHSRRHRLADCDGLSAKAVIDGLVIAGVLPDDTTKEITEISYSQEKISKEENEETIVTFYKTINERKGYAGV